MLSVHRRKEGRNLFFFFFLSPVSQYWYIRADVHRHLIESPGEIKIREVELVHRHLIESPREIKSSKVELGCHSGMDCLAAELFLDSRFPNTVFVTLFRTAVETAVSEVHKSLNSYWRVPTSLTLLFWRWLAVSSVFTGRSSWVRYS